jgi:hypothetical protein
MSLAFDSPPISTLFHGDVTIQEGFDTIDYGYGDLTVGRKIVIRGTEGSFSCTSGALILTDGSITVGNSFEALSSMAGGAMTIAGGLAVGKNVFVGTNFDVDGHATLDQVSIDTDDGPFRVQGQHSIDFAVNSSSSFLVSSGNLLLTSLSDAGQMVLESKGSNNALQIVADSPGGGVDIKTAGSGFNVTTKDNGPLSLEALSATSNFTVSASNDNQNLYLQLLGEHQSTFHILSAAKGELDVNNNIVRDALLLETTHSEGNIKLKAEGAISVQSSKVRIGTELSETLSQVTLGTLDVKDNFVTVNVSAGPQNLDGGISVKRYQTVADNGNGGNVVGNGTVVLNGDIGSNNTSTTIELPLVEIDIAEFWIKLIASDNSFQVRKIKSFDLNTGIAEIYSTSDHDSDPQSPRVGQDWTTFPDSETYTTYTFELYKCNYVSSFWDESESSWKYTCGPSKEPVDNLDYVDVHVGNMNATSVTTGNMNATSITTANIIATSLTTGNINTTSINNLDIETFLQGDSLRQVTLHDNVDDLTSNEGQIDLNTENKNYGIYMLFVRPLVEEDDRPSAIFMIGRSSNGSVAAGSIVKLISVRGKNNSQLDLSWTTGFPKLSYRPYPTSSDNSTTTYVIKLLKV